MKRTVYMNACNGMAYVNKGGWRWKIRRDGERREKIKSLLCVIGEEGARLQYDGGVLWIHNSVHRQNPWHKKMYIPKKETFAAFSHPHTHIWYDQNVYICMCCEFYHRHIIFMCIYQWISYQKCSSIKFWTSWPLLLNPVEMLKKIKFVLILNENWPNFFTKSKYHSVGFKKLF